MKSIFEKFGGIRPMAAKLGLPVSTVKSWHSAKSIPEWRRRGIMEAAGIHRVPVTFDEIENVRPDSTPFRRGAPAQQEAA